MIGKLEILTGTASMMAEYNGVTDKDHIQRKLSWMAMITETVFMLSQSACMNPEYEQGHSIAMPNKMAINASKFTFASNIHQMCQHVQDISGGLAATVPTYRDWINDDIKPYIEKYLCAKDGVSTEDRLRMLRLAKDYTSNFYQIDTIHGEGSMAAQQKFLYSSADWDKYHAAAKRAANVHGWENHDIYGKLPVTDEEVNMPEPDPGFEAIPKTAKKS